VADGESGAGQVLGSIRMDDLMAAISDEPNEHQGTKADASAVS
jgi:hypothetical protein